MEESLETQKVILHPWFDKVFIFVARYTSYTFAVSLFSTGVAGIVASLFALYYFDAVKVKLLDLSMKILKIGIVSYWILIATQLGLFYRLGFPSFGKTLKILNSHIIIKNNISIVKYLQPQEYKDLLKALMFFPILNGINLAIWIFSLVLIMQVLAYFVEGFRLDLVTAIWIVGFIAIFIAIAFSSILSEFFISPMIEECKKILSQREIFYKQKAFSSVRIKLVLFLILFIVNLFISNTLTYYNQAEMHKVWHFALLAVLVSMVLAHAIFKLIYNSLKQIEKASYDLMKGGSGQIYSRSLDREFINVALGINQAAKTILDYQHSLEEKVALRTKELNQALEELKKKDLIMETELKFAAEIQKCILPSNLETWNGIGFASYYKPMGQVSGDYYDIFYFPSQIYVLIADVSGHGVPAALITMAAKQAFHANIKEGISPREVFQLVNLEITQRVTTSDYLSAFLIKIDTSHKIIYANAAHPKVIHYIASEDEYKLLDTGGMFIGSLVDANDFYEERETKLHTGDRFYLYTDGLLEHKNPEGEEFGIDRVIEVLDKYKNLSLQEQVDKLVESLYIHISTAPIKDDISILALELEPKWNYFLEIYNKGLSLLKNKNFTQALDLFSEAQKLIPNYHFIQFQLALIYYHLGKYEFAQEHILKYLEFQPNDQMGLKLAANIFTKSRKIEKAQEFIQKLNELGSQKDG